MRSDLLSLRPLHITDTLAVIRKKENQLKREKVIVYGFDKLGYNLPGKALDGGQFSFEILGSTELEGSWEKAKGLIILSGTFENFYRDTLGFFRANYKQNVLSVIENHFYNLIGRGGWVCFLLVDDLIKKTDKDGDIRTFDLSKKFASQLGLDWINKESTDPVLSWKFDEFKSYIQKYGMRKTEFERKSYNNDITVLSGDKENFTAFEAYKKIFFLPFQPTSTKDEMIIEVSTLLGNSINSYLLKTSTTLPEWTNEFQLQREINLIEEINVTNQKLNTIKEKLKGIRDYKLLLTTSGDNLRKIGITVLEEEFGYVIDPIDNGLEDAKIMNGDEILAFVEFKGTNKGVKREYINQVDSHRERNNVDSSYPGILIINTKMKSSSIHEKMDETIAKEHIVHAERMNVTIIRTVDLLNVIKLNENQLDKISILDLSRLGGGLVTVRNDNVVLVKEENYDS